MAVSSAVEKTSTLSSRQQPLDWMRSAYSCPEMRIFLAPVVLDNYIAGALSRLSHVAGWSYKLRRPLHRQLGVASDGETVLHRSICPAFAPSTAPHNSLLDHGLVQAAAIAYAVSLHNEAVLGMRKQEALRYQRLEASNLNRDFKAKALAASTHQPFRKRALLLPRPPPPPPLASQREQ